MSWSDTEKAQSLEFSSRSYSGGSTSVGGNGSKILFVGVRVETY